MKQTKGLIAVHDLAIGYASGVIAKDINFNLCSGELCAIVGVNGIGKSTLYAR
jgi:iron complex transport system ATP-binding protein